METPRNGALAKGWCPPPPLLLLLTILSATGCGPGGPEESPDDPGSSDGPSLVVMLVVDQLRADLLDRYDPWLTGGIRRLLDGGLRFTHATHDHAVTATAPGHATLATGRFPAHHGLVGNEWWESTPGGWREVYAVADSAAPILGVPGAPGRSPRNLRGSGLGDWVRKRHPEARTLSVSRKDRAAIPLGGLGGGHAYWLHESSGRFVTSRYYRSEYPAWLLRFNREVMPRFHGDSVWESTVPRDAGGASRPDAHPNEGDGVHTTFPHRAMQEIGAGPGVGEARLRRRYLAWLADAPVLDEAVLDLARAGTEALDLGRRGTVDYLAVSLSQTDAVGHDYGPLSREQLDNLLRLDRALGAFLAFLDRWVGEGRWVLGFSADHGVADLPEWALDQGREAGRVDFEEAPVLPAARAAHARGGPAAVLDTLAAFPGVLEALPLDALAPGAAGPRGSPGWEAADTFRVLARNGFVPERRVDLERFGVLVRQRPGWVDDGDGLGTTHLSPYHYDRWVPFIVYGGGIEPGVRGEPVSAADLAPTLAALAGIPVQGPVDGRARGPTPRPPPPDPR